MKITDQKILLILFPFWPTLIPPTGISALTNFLRKKGFNIKATDMNLVLEFKNLYNKYFEILNAYVPENKKGNFFSIGRDVIRNHMLAYASLLQQEEQQEYESEKLGKTYYQLLSSLVYETFFVDFETPQIQQLNQIVKEIFKCIEEQLLTLLEAERPTILGGSVYKGTTAATLHGFRLAKKHFPRIQTVMGGAVFADQLALDSPNLEIFLEKTKDCIDKIIVGEGEHLFLKLLQGELPNSQRLFSLKDIDFKIMEVENSVITDLSDFQLNYYPYLATCASRGCPFNCSFCSETVLWGKYRKKDAAKTVAEMIHLSTTYNSQLFLLTDSLMNPTITDLSNELYNAGVSLYWDGYLRADKQVCDMENTILWRKGGFYRARLGIESGSQRILDLMGKKISPQQIKDALTSLAFAGIKTSTLWIIGYPGESEEDFLQTLDLISQCKDYLYDAEGTPFWYYLTGQSNSKNWIKKNKLLYPRDTADLLLLQEWILDDEPSRETTYQRLNRFVAHCRDLEIPNPYSMNEIYEADIRWKNLHKNAVPPLVDFHKGILIDENKSVCKLSYINLEIEEEGDFTF